MKKLLAVWMVLMMLLPVCGLAEGTETAGTEEIAEATEKLPVNLNYDYDELVVGSTMPMFGNFSFSMWGNASSDIDVRKLIHGYNLVEWETATGGFQLDPNVVSGKLVEDENGDHIYNLILCDDMYYSDGTRITAWDYAFSFLLRMSPVISELGGVPARLDYIVGYSDYISGASNTLSGIRVTGDNQIMIRISADYLPFFYEVGLLDCYPYPASVIAPGCEVLDSEDGISLSAPLDAAQLKQTLMDAETGYLSHPSIVSGAYKLVSFDGKEARFELNEYYKGNSEGVKPVIPRIVYRTADEETMIDQLAGSEYGLLNKVMWLDAIQAGNNLRNETGRYRFTSYPRPGLSFIAFNTENAAVSEAAVRQAIAMCLDKQGLTTDYTGPYGLQADGFFGIGQWMYQMVVTRTIQAEMPEDATDEEIAKLEEEWAKVTLDDLDVYEFDTEAAAKLLEDNGWKLNANGIREKEINGQTVALELKMIYPSATPIGEFLQTRFAEPLKAAGIALTIVEEEDVLSRYYGQIERDYDMAFLASNFDVMFDPSPLFAPGGANNTTGINDQELYDLAADMKKTEPGDLLSYCQKWTAFVKRFAEVEPMIPVYSNVYYDFYPDVLQEYNISTNITWSEAIVPAYLSDPAEETEEAEGEMVID